MQTTVKDIQVSSQIKASGVDVSTHKTLGHSSNQSDNFGVFDNTNKEVTDLGLLSLDTSGAVVSQSERVVVQPLNLGLSCDPGMIKSVMSEAVITQSEGVFSHQRDSLGDHSNLGNGSPTPIGVNVLTSINSNDVPTIGLSSYIPSSDGIAIKSRTEFSTHTSSVTLDIPKVRGSSFCQILHMRHNGIDSDLILLCQSHMHDNIVLKPANSFKVFRCSNLVFKSVLGRIELSGLNGGSSDSGVPDKKEKGKKVWRKREDNKDIEIDLKQKKQVRSKDDIKINYKDKKKSQANKGFKNIINQAMLDHAAKLEKPVEDVGGYNLADTIKWYSKNWKLPNQYKFMMVRGQPVLELNHEGKWLNVGLANKVYNSISDVGRLIQLANFGDNERQNIVPVMEKIDYPEYINVPYMTKDKSRADGLDLIIESELEKIDNYFKKQDESDEDSEQSEDEQDALGALDLILGGDGPDGNTDNNDDNGSESSEQEAEVPLIPLKLVRWDDGYSLGEPASPIMLNDKQFELFLRFAKYFDIPHISRKFVEETLQIPFEGWVPRLGVKLGNFTGLNHPKSWDGIWKGDLVPINEGDFISSFHDMMTNNNLSLEQGFVNWWSDAEENFISQVMGLLLPFRENTGHGSWVLPQNVVDRVGSEGSFNPTGREFEVIDQQSGLMGAGRGDEWDIGRAHPLVAISDVDSDNSRSAWTPELFNFKFDSSQPINFQLRETPSWGRIFHNTSFFTQLTNSFRVAPAVDIPQYVGARFQPSTSVLVVSATGSYRRIVTGVILAESQIGADYPIVYKPSFESLAALNPQASYSSVSSANRSYTTTPYGDLGDLVYLHKITNLYISKNVVNMFLPCFRMLRFAAMCERGSYDANRGAYLAGNVMEFYSQGVLSPGVFSFTSTIRFVYLSDYLNLLNTPAMQAVTAALKGPGGKMAFMGSMNGDQSHDFILQLLMLGVDAPMFCWLGAAYDLNATPTLNVFGMVDVSMLFRRVSNVNIIVFMGSEATPFNSGPQAYGTMLANSPLATISAVDIYYNAEDLIGTYISAGWNYWTTRAYNLVLSLGCTDFWQQAMFFFLHNCSVSEAPTTVDRYAQWSDGANSPFPPVDAVYPYTNARAATSVAPMKFQFAPGLEGDQTTAAGTNWNITWSDLTIRVPQESGFEYLVIFGFCEPSKRLGTIVSFDPVTTWSARFWAPEFMSQAYAETNREFFYSGALYNKTKTYSAVPPKIINLYNQSIGRDNKYIPQGMVSVHKYYGMITSSTVQWDVIQPTLGWIMTHSSVYASWEVLPYQRPEFLAYVSNFTSTKLAVWGPSPYEPLTTPKLTKQMSEKMDNTVFGGITYEISAKMNASSNTPLSLESDLVKFSYGALNLAEHYIVLTLGYTRQSKKNSGSFAVAKVIYKSFRLRDHYTYCGSNFTLYKVLYYDIEIISPLAVTNLTNSSAITVSKVLNTYMSVASTDWHAQTDMADPNGNLSREQNFSLIDSLFTSDVEIMNEKGSNSQQELESIAPKSGITVSAGGVPVAKS